jgi:hypothetical protein
MSAKIVMSNQIQANSSMNQKIDRMMSQNVMAALPARRARSDHQHCRSQPGRLTREGDRQARAQRRR